MRFRATDEAGNTSPVGTTNVTIAALPNCSPVTPEPGFKALYDGTIQSLADWTMAGPGGFQPRSGECVIDAWGGMGLLWYAKQQLVSPYTIRAEWRIYGDDDNSGVFIGFPDPLDDPWKPVARATRSRSTRPTPTSPARRARSTPSRAPTRPRWRSRSSRTGSGTRWRWPSTAS